MKINYLSIATLSAMATFSSMSYAVTFVEDNLQIEDKNDPFSRVTFDNGTTGPNLDWNLVNSLFGDGSFTLTSFDPLANPVNQHPFRVLHGAPTNTLFIDANGRVGLGTSTPGGLVNSRLTISPIPGENSSILFEGLTEDYVLFNNNSLFGIYEPARDMVPFYTEYGANEASLMVSAESRVGIGTPNPEVNLHVLDDGPAALKVQSTDASSTADQVMFKLANASNAKVRFSIKAGAAAWTFDNSPFLDEFSISRVGTGQNEFALKTNGDGTFRGNSYAVQHFNTSSRATKTDFAEIDVQGVLAGVLALPVSQWRYKSEEQDARHIGPVAEDFEAVFDLGDGKTISTVDATGLAFAAIQGLKQEKDAELAGKDAQIAALQAEVQQLKAEQDERMMQLELVVAEVLRKQSDEMQVGSTD